MLKRLLAASIVTGVSFGCAAHAPPAATKPSTTPFAKTPRWPNSYENRVAARRDIFAEARKARSVIFVCDTSGSMTNKFASLKELLSIAINDLDEKQLFNVVFAQDGVPFIFTNTRLHPRTEMPVPASAENKKQAIAFLEEVTTSSTGDLSKAIVAGLREQPELMYVITDGDLPDNDLALKLVRQENRDRKVRICTIAFVDPAKDTEQDFLVLLQTIAKESGGTYQYVDETKLWD